MVTYLQTACSFCWVGRRLGLDIGMRDCPYPLLDMLRSDDAVLPVLPGRDAVLPVQRC